MTANLALPEVMARIHIEDIGLMVTYLGSVDDIVSTGLVTRDMIPAVTDESSGYFRGRLELVKTSLCADLLIITRWGEDLVQLRFWGEANGAPATVRSHAWPWDNKVVSLPTAAAVAPVQPARRGRYPRNVTHIRCGQELRNAHSTREKLIAAKQTALRCFEGHINTCLAEIAELQARQ